MTTYTQVPRRSRNPQTLSLIAAVTAFVLLVPVAVVADTQAAKSETATATVSLADLDISAAAGARAARDRLHTRLQQLCRRFLDDRKVSSWETYVDCCHDTFANARQKLNERTLVARTEQSDVGRIEP